MFSGGSRSQIRAVFDQHDKGAYFTKFVWVMVFQWHRYHVSTKLSQIWI